MNSPKDNICALWKTTAETSRFSSFNWQFDSARAGGIYSLDLLTFNRMPDEVETNIKLTTWLIDQRRAGDQCPAITSEVIDRVRAKPFLRLSDRIDRFFLYLISRRLKIGQLIDFGQHPNIDYFTAWTESESADELVALISMMEKMSLIQTTITNEFSLTSTGFERLDSLRHQLSSTPQGFVAMWFGPELNSAYEDGFSAGITSAGFVPFRIDKKEHSNKIDDEIIAEIRRSRFVVADFTCPLTPLSDNTFAPNARGGVYYEAGFAQGLQIPVIWTVREDCLQYVHFDTRQFAHIVWREPIDLKESLLNRIGAIII
jgi:hypothetical protein